MELKENERIDDLEFKGYKIIQNTTGFCFGIDSVLLSDYAKDIKSGAEIIDIGTGTGIIGILLTGKTNNTHITGIEIQSEVADMARRSIKLNGIEDRFCIKNMNIKDIFKEMQQNKIDAIVTNPPYMRENTGAKNIEKNLRKSKISSTFALLLGNNA